MIRLILCMAAFGLVSELIGQQEEAPLTVVSGEAEYNGNEIKLIGEVIVQHDLGTISAHQFTISPGKEGKGQFSQLTMSNDVKIELQKGGSLTCQQADVDYDALQGNFIGSDENPAVVYTYMDKNNAELKIIGKQMEAGFIALDETDKKSVLNQIQVDDEVEVHFNRDYLIKGDRAHYQRDLANPDFDAGRVTVSVQNAPFCTLLNGIGDRIKAAEIVLNTESKELIFSHADGFLISRNVKFSGDELIWNDPDRSLTLKGNAEVNLDDMLGEMSADTVLIHYNNTGKRIEPSRVVLDGNVKIYNRFDGHAQESGSVLQYALADHVDYDPALQEMVLSCPEGNRVLFFDKINSIQMSAPILKVSFDKETGREKVHGVGDVRFTFIEREFEQLKQRFKMGGKDGK